MAQWHYDTFYFRKGYEGTVALRCILPQEKDTGRHSGTPMHFTSDQKYINHQDIAMDQGIHFTIDHGHHLLLSTSRIVLVVAL